MNLNLFHLPKLSNTKLFFLCFFLIILLEIPISYIIGFLDKDALLGFQVDATPLGVFGDFMVSVLMVPFLETIIFQVIIIELLIWLRAKPLVAIMVSSIIFALAHYYNAYYILVVFPSGFLFSYYYYILRTREDVWFALLLVTLLHALINLLAVFGTHFL